MLLLECVVYVRVRAGVQVCVCEPKPEEGVRSSLTTFWVIPSRKGLSLNLGLRFLARLATNKSQ